MDFFFGPSKKQPSKELINRFVQMGFTSDAVTKAWEACKGNETQMLDHLFAMAQKNQKMAQEGSPYTPYTRATLSNSKGFFREDSDVSRAIELSLAEQGTNTSAYEPLNPEQRIRPRGFPVGLKNVGNTCYVNSLFQAYFTSHDFVAAVLQFNPEVTHLDEFMTASPAKIKGEQDLKRWRVEASIKLIKNLQKLFSKMIKSDKKYVDPTEVLNSVVDDMGNKIAVGDQRDITEYHLNFLSRIEEAFYYQEKCLKAQKETALNSPVPIEDLPASFMTLTSMKGSLQLDTSSTATRENSIIAKHYFGKMKQFMSFAQDGEKVVEEKEIIFGPIILDVSNKDFYTAFETYCNFSLEDYRTPNGVLTPAEGHLWATRLPEMLFIQLNRVVFDKSHNMPVKLNNKFVFEKEIYLDRFMVDYKEETRKINQKIADLKAELEQKENSLQKLMNFLESKQDIIKILELTGSFLQKQMEFDMSQPLIHNEDPSYIGPVDDPTRISIATDIVLKYKYQLENKMQELRNSINSIKGTINNLWGALNKHKYYLVSILIHDGSAGSGHYYSFNRNVQTGTWKRFNDFQVSEEQEEVVMTEALGGYANMSAYCLVYLSEHNIKKELGLTGTAVDFLTGDTMPGNEIEKHHYNKLVPPPLANEVIADNLNFQDEVEEYKFRSLMKSAVDLYQVRYDTITKALQSKTANSPPTHLNSFASFLKYDPHFERLFKWYLLDTVLQEYSNENNKLKLRSLKSSPVLFQNLQNRMSSLPKPFGFSSLVLTNQEENQLDCKLAEYTAEYPIIIYVRFLLVSLLNERWQDACCAIKLVCDLEKNQTSYIFKLVKDSTKVACLKLAMQAERYIKTSQVGPGLDAIVYLTAFVKGLLKPDEIHTSQVRMILTDALIEAKSQLPEITTNTFKEQIQKFNAAFHVSGELDKVIQNYSPLALQRELEMFTGENFYAWKEIDENSPSNQIKMLVKQFMDQLKYFVDFHNGLFHSKNPLKLDERKKYGYML